MVRLLIPKELTPMSVPDSVVLEFLASYDWKFRLTDNSAICDWCEFRAVGKRVSFPDLCGDCARRLGLLW